MKADPKVLADLQAAAGMLATMAEQFRLDAAQLDALDIGWLAGKVWKWYHKSEHHLGIVITQLFAFQTVPAYSIAKPATGGDPKVLLERDYILAQSGFDQFCKFRKSAWDIRADYVPDIYEHAIEALQKIIAKIEQQQRLIENLGLSGYIGSRLEDE